MVTVLASAASGVTCYAAYYLLGIPLFPAGAVGRVLQLAPLVTPILVAPVVAIPQVRASKRMAQLFAEVESTRTELLAEVAERKLTQARLEDLVRRDPLTGLLNRRGFFEAWANGAGGAETALVTVDLDRFKAINDAYGHAAGDRVLRAAALKLMELLGGDSCVARIGGDEFAIMMPASADRLAWLRSELNSLHVEVADGITARISASVGVAHSSDQMSVDEVLALADAGMYSEKRARAADDLLRVDLDSLRPS